MNYLVKLHIQINTFINNHKSRIKAQKEAFASLVYSSI